MIKKTTLFLHIALKFSISKRNNTMSYTSLISIFGIIIGVAVLTIGLSLMNGFERELQNRVLSIIPHEEIESISKPFINWKNILKLIQYVPGVISAAPYLNFNGLIMHNNKFKVIQIKAIDPILENKLTKLFFYIKNGNLLNFKSGKHQIILGKGVAEDLDVKSGDYIELIIHNSYSYLNQRMFRPKHIILQINSVLELHSQFDNYLAIVHILDAQKYLNRNGDIDGIAIRNNDALHSNKIILDLKKIINQNQKINSWIDNYNYIYNDIKMVRVILYLTMIIVIVVSCFNMVSHLIKTLQDKSNDIAILIALGMEKKHVILIFTYYGLLITFVGTTIGLTLGMLISSCLNLLIKWIEILFNFNLFLKNIYFIDFLPYEFRISDIMIIIFISTVLGILSSWYPSYYVSKISPIKTLNNK